MESVADRLHRAISAWPSGTYRRLGPRARPSIQSFAKIASAKASGAGTSRPQLQRYLAKPKNGRSPPSPPDALLSVADEVLGIRYDWLKSGVGEMTPAAEATRLAREGAPSTEEPKGEVEQIHATFEEMLPGLERGSLAFYALDELLWLIVNSEGLPKVFRDEINAAARSVGKHETGGPLLDVTEGYRRFAVAMAEQLGNGVHSMLEVLGLEWKHLQDASQRDTYVVLYCEAAKAAWLNATTRRKGASDDR